ncbi:MAG: hypothetical protein ABEJ70_00340 [Halobacteriaceae archaeon]
MTDDARTDDDGTGRSVESGAEEARPTVEAYEADDGTVFFDAENPLAWVRSTMTVPLEQ